MSAPTPVTAPKPVFESAIVRTVAERQRSSADVPAGARMAPVACSLCHTAHHLTHEDDWWDCPTCGASWDAHRLAVVEGYRRFCLTHDVPRRQKR